MVKKIQTLQINAILTNLEVIYFEYIGKIQSNLYIYESTIIILVFFLKLNTMRKIGSLLEEYGESHQTKFNKRVHYFCVPLIFFSIIGLLSTLPVPKFITNMVPTPFTTYAHFGTLIILLGLVYYLILSFRLFIGMFLFSSLVLFTISALEIINFAPLWLIMIFIFSVSWVFQFIGHNHEGKKPSFLKDVQFLMIGPAWTLSHIFDVFNIKY